VKFSNIFKLFVLLSLGSLCVFSSTLAQYSSECSGSDAALAAKWNFRVGNAADNLHNQGFTFDVFDNQPLEPQAGGENSFIVSGGQSDVAIEYEVLMNVDVLLDISGIGDGNDYPPLIFYVSSPSATVLEPYNEWFDLNDIETDSEGYFLIAAGEFDSNSAEMEEITIHWWWNTSFYVGTPDPDITSAGDYYDKALSDYNSLVNIYNNLANQANSFFEQHQRIVTTVDGVEQVTYNCVAGDACPYGDSDEDHMAAYNLLVVNADSALDAVNNSLKMQYDAYDTSALAALAGLDPADPQRIGIKVVGSQVTPDKI